MYLSLFPSDTVKFSLSMNATIGLRTELRFLKAIGLQQYIFLGYDMYLDTSAMIQYIITYK